MRGPKPRPKPTEQAVELGAPAHLSAAAQAEWTKFVTQLSPSRILTDLDCAALEVLATSLVQYREAQAHIDQHGTVVVGTTGTPVKNPYNGVQKDAWDRIRPLLAEFGLTPSARARLNMGDPAEQQDDFFNRRAK